MWYHRQPPQSLLTMLPKTTISFAKCGERVALLSRMLKSPTTQGFKPPRDYCFLSTAVYKYKPVRQGNK